jgi:hypothetical protein
MFTWSCLDDLTGARPSISSKKMIEGLISCKEDKKYSFKNI